MKRIIRIVSLVLAVCLAMCGMCVPVFAMQSSGSYRIGLRKGRVLKSGKTFVEGPYKDIYESEKVELNQFVSYAPNSTWTRTAETSGYSLTRSVTASCSVGVSWLESIGSKPSVTLSRSTSGSMSIHPNKKKGGYCRPCIRCDYVMIRYRRVYSNYRGRNICRSESRTVRIPLKNTMVLVYKYRS